MKILGIDLGKFNSVACLYHSSNGRQHFRSLRTIGQEIHDLIVECEPDVVVFVFTVSESGSGRARRVWESGVGRSVAHRVRPLDVDTPAQVRGRLGACSVRTFSSCSPSGSKKVRSAPKLSIASTPSPRRRARMSRVGCRSTRLRIGKS